MYSHLHYYTYIYTHTRVRTLAAGIYIYINIYNTYYCCCYDFYSRTLNCFKNHRRIRIKIGRGTGCQYFRNKISPVTEHKTCKVDIHVTLTGRNLGPSQAWIQNRGEVRRGVVAQTKKMYIKNAIV